MESDRVPARDGGGPAEGDAVEVFEVDTTGAQPTPADRPFALSPSRASDFKSCPLKYRYRAIDRLPEPPSAAAARGTLVHSALESLFRRPREERVEGVATGLLPGLWRDMVEREPDLGGLPGVTDLGAWLGSARALLRQYFQLEDPSRFDPEACELHLEVTLPAGVPTRGYVDRLDVSPTGMLRIVDYKTGKAPRAAYADDALFQLKFYALMLYRLRGVVAARLRLLYLGDGGIIEFTPDEAGLVAFESTVVTLWETISAARESGRFPTKRSRLCDWCSFQAHCPEFGGMVLPYPTPEASPALPVRTA